jgi:hypothetical protein
MQSPSTLILSPVAHPDPRVHRAGFGLDHPYLERCWLPVLGPTSVLLLRRMPTLWQRDPAIGVPVDELASVLGLGRGTGRHSPVWRTVDRLARFGFANRLAENELEVYTEAPPLSVRHLAALPPSVRESHDRLLTAHLTELGLVPNVPTPAPPTVTVSLPDLAGVGSSNGTSGRSL